MGLIGNWHGRAIGLLSTAALLTGCAMTPQGIAQPGASPQPTTVAASPSLTPAATPTAKPSTVSASPSTTAKPMSKAAPKSATPYAVTMLTKAQKKKLGSCLSKTVGPGSTGACAKAALTYLKKAGFYGPAPAGYISVTGANAILNYQRSRGISPTASVGPVTWVALVTKAPAVPVVTPDICLAKGVVLCVDKAHRRLTWYRNGKAVKTFAVRVGGWNVLPKNDKRPNPQWRVFATANGVWHVYDKQVNPASDNYGSGAMPYSTMFYPDMYVHYSPGFNAVGYSGSSHGCVNIRKLSEAQWIFKNTPIGATVFIYGGL